MSGSSGAGARWVTFEGATNFRDLGGYPALLGRQTRWGLVYRSGNLHHLTAKDLERFERLGVKAVFDLRGGTERRLEPDPVASFHMPVLDEAASSEAASVLVARSAREAEEALFHIYWGMLERRAAVFGQLLSHLAEPENLPAVVHCAGGKDRTGLAAALLLSTLGVPREVVLEDYALSGEVPAAGSQSLRQALAGAGVPSEAASVLLESPPGPMARCLLEIDRRYGSTEAYLLGPAGVAPATLSRLRELLTDWGPADQEEPGDG